VEETDMDESKSVKVIIATHKKYRMPNDDMYLPLYVGAEGKKDRKGDELNLGYVKDNTGENISSLNPSFCELTGLYWAWKNLVVDYIGLVHYRRYFGVKGRRKTKDPFDSVCTFFWENLDYSPPTSESITLKPYIVTTNILIMLIN